MDGNYDQMKSIRSVRSKKNDWYQLKTRVQGDLTENWAPRKILRYYD